MLPLCCCGQNWGLITYRDNAILWDPAVNTIAQLQRVAFVMAHELAHQWFGNIVTAAWWSQLWLNEGFARFMQFLAGAAVSPELQLTEQFITVAQRQALITDSSRNTNPIVTDNGGGLSDITYAKGASVLRMIVGLIGEGVFDDGIRQVSAAAPPTPGWLLRSLPTHSPFVYDAAVCCLPCVVPQAVPVLQRVHYRPVCYPRRRREEGGGSDQRD